MQVIIDGKGVESVWCVVKLMFHAFHEIMNNKSQDLKYIWQFNASFQHFKRIVPIAWWTGLEVTIKCFYSFHLHAEENTIASNACYIHEAMILLCGNSIINSSQNEFYDFYFIFLWKKKIAILQSDKHKNVTYFSLFFFCWKFMDVNNNVK